MSWVKGCGCASCVEFDQRDGQPGRVTEILAAVGEWLQRRSDNAFCSLMEKASGRTHSRERRERERFWDGSYVFLNPDPERSFREAIRCGCLGCLEFAGAFK